VTGKVVEREQKNTKRETGDVEIIPTELVILGTSKTPPFKIEDETDAGEQSRMQYRYLDIRRNPVKDALMLRNKITIAVRKALNNLAFCEVETPILIKSTPEGARDFIVPSRENPGKFYALPQSPQTFKQLLMVGGMDRYFQITRCFRDEGTVITQNRQPEFTQLDCEMSFVTQEDVLSTFEKLMTSLIKDVTGFELPPLKRISFDECMADYGIDKPDLRFEMKLCELTSDIQPCEKFPKFDKAEAVIAIVLESKYNEMSKKELDKAFDRKALETVDELLKLADKKGVQGGIFWVKVISLKEKKFESPLSKNFTDDQFAAWATKANAVDNSVMLLLAGPNAHLETRMCMGKLRHHFGNVLGLRSHGFSALWVVDFPLLEWDEDEGRCVAMHHPFTSPRLGESTDLFMTVDPKGDPAPLENIRANAYDMVLNGIEAGGGSIRIVDPKVQARMFELLNMSVEEYTERFGFLMDAFEMGAPPHGGLAFGLDRLCTIIGEGVGIPQQLDKPTISIRDYMAFPKTKGGQDAMIKAPCILDKQQLGELYIQTTVTPEPDEDEKKGPALGNVDEARMSEISAALEALQAKEPPNPRGKPTPEWLEQSKAHAVERAAYEATMNETEIAVAQARGWYVKGPKGAGGGKDKKKDKKAKGGGEQPKAQPKQEAKKEAKKEEPKASKKDKKKASKEDKPADPEAEAKAAAKKLKAVEKEGGKKGVEIEGASEMGGLAYFCTTVTEPDGDMALLEASFASMNAIPDPDPEEERRGGAGGVGKMCFSAGVEFLQIVCNVPEELQVDKDMDGKVRKAMNAKEWVDSVLSRFEKEAGVLKAEGDASYAKGSIPANKDIGFFPLKIKDDAMSYAYGKLRENNCFNDDASSDGPIPVNSDLDDY